jgi:head-tail adaptor
MRAGKLDRRVIVQRFVSSSSPSGEPIETWAAIGPARFASKTPVTGIERFGSQQLESKEQIEFRLRWAADLADLQPTDRIIEPASDAVGPIAERSIYDIFAVLEINRREGLRVLATRRTGNSPAATALAALTSEDDIILTAEDGATNLTVEG